MDGPVIPSWGSTDSAPGAYGGKPGRGFAKILEELWTEVSPTAAYWSPTVLREDTRIPALGKDVSEYDFLAPAGGGAVRVGAKLVFRRAFRQLSIWKQWNDADILMKQSAVSVAANPSGIAPLAVVHAATQQGDVPLAQGAIATVYDAGLASASSAAGGTGVFIRDQSGAETGASLLYVSSGQISFVLPGGIALGNAVLKVMRDNQLAGASAIVLASIAPGLFTANGKETGPAAAMVVYVAADGSQTIAPAFTCRAVGDCSTAPISIQTGAAKAYLSLYGTGIRGVSSQAGMRVAIGGIDAPGPEQECPDRVFRCRKCGSSAQTELDGFPACSAGWKAINVSHGPACPKNLPDEAMDTPNGVLVRRCFRIMGAKSMGLTITLSDITEEEFRAMEMIEAARQEQVADEDKDAKSFQELLLRKLSRGRSYRPLRCKSVGTRSRSIP